MSLFAKRLSRQDSLTLLLIVAFPIHVWAILIGFYNFQAVAERAANLLEGLGYLSYVMLTALVESLLLFGFLYLLNFLLPKEYGGAKRVVQLGWLGTAFSLWMILRQLFNFYGGGTAEFVTGLGRPFLVTILGLALLLVVIVLSIGWPLLNVHRSPRAEERLRKFFERLIPLSVLYLVLDGIGLLVVLARNIF